MCRKTKSNVKDGLKQLEQYRLYMALILWFSYCIISIRNLFLQLAPLLGI